MTTDVTCPRGIPPTAVSDPLREQWQREQARRELTLGAIRSHLEEQPSPHSVRACARRWCSDITNLAETVLAERQNQEQAE